MSVPSTTFREWTLSEFIIQSALAVSQSGVQRTLHIDNIFRETEYYSLLKNEGNKACIPRRPSVAGVAENDAEEQGCCAVTLSAPAAQGAAAASPPSAQPCPGQWQPGCPSPAVQAEEASVSSRLRPPDRPLVPRHHFPALFTPTGSSVQSSGRDRQQRRAPCCTCVHTQSVPAGRSRGQGSHTRECPPHTQERVLLSRHRPTQSLLCHGGPCWDPCSRAMIWTATPVPWLHWDQAISRHLPPLSATWLCRTSNYCNKASDILPILGKWPKYSTSQSVSISE